MEKFGGSINNMSMESMQEDYLIDAQEKFFEEQKKRYQPNAENFLAESGFDPEEIKKEIALSEKLKTQWEESGSDFEKRRLVIFSRELSLINSVENGWQIKQRLFQLLMQMIF
jgi:hypothetical protein